jgi:hypothetical protein
MCCRARRLRVVNQFATGYESCHLLSRCALRASERSQDVAARTSRRGSCVLHVALDRSSALARAQDVASATATLHLEQSY